MLDRRRMILNRLPQTAHYSDAIMGAMVSQIAGVSILYQTVCSGADQRKYQSFVSLAFVRGILTGDRLIPVTNCQ